MALKPLRATSAGSASCELCDLWPYDARKPHTYRTYAWFPALRFRSSVIRVLFFFRCRSYQAWSSPAPTWKRGKLARQPGGPAGPTDNSTSPFASIMWCMHGTESPKRQRHYDNGVTDLRLRNGSTDTVLRKRIRMNGNVTLETRQYCM